MFYYKFVFYVNHFAFLGVQATKVECPQKCTVPDRLTIGPVDETLFIPGTGTVSNKHPIGKYSHTCYLKWYVVKQHEGMH